MRGVRNLALVWLVLLLGCGGAEFLPPPIPPNAPPPADVIHPDLRLPQLDETLPVGTIRM